MDLEKIISFCGEVGSREFIYAIEIFSLALACVLILIGGTLISGSGMCLGKPYGKTNFIKATIKYLFVGLSFLVAFALSFFWIYDFVVNFSNISLWYIVAFAIGATVYLLCFFKSQKFQKNAEEKLIERYKDEINAILMDNPIFSTVVNQINSDASWKTIRIYRDGVAFYRHIADVPHNNEEKITNGATSNSEAEKLLKNKVSDWLKTEGNVLYSNGDHILKYADYGFGYSENAMKDIAKHLERLLKPRFKCYENKKIWSYNGDLFSTSNTYIVSNGVATPAGSSHKKITACDGATANYVLIETSSHEKDQSNLKASLKQW